MKTMTILSSLAFAALISACGNTADGVKKDATKAGEKTAEAASDATTAMGGAMKTGEVKTAILADSRVHGTDINVDTDETAKTVTLKGSVKSDAEKVIAGEIAATKATGYSIVNTLTIKP
jgi:osmotically-inducible protein OsmY